MEFDDFPSLDDIFEKPTVDKSKNQTSDDTKSTEKEIQPTFLQSSKFILPATPVKKKKTKYGFDKIQKNADKFLATSVCLQKISDEPISCDLSPLKIGENFCGKPTSIVRNVDKTGLAETIAGNEHSLAYPGIPIFEKINCKTGDNCFPQFDSNKDKTEILELFFNLIAFLDDDEIDTFVNRFLSVSKSQNDDWFPRIDHFLAILCCYGANLKKLLVILRLDEEVSVYIKKFDHFAPNFDRLVQNLTTLLEIIVGLAKKRNFLTVNSCLSWLSIISYLSVASEFRISTVFHCLSKDFVEKLLISIPEQIRAEVYQRFICLTLELTPEHYLLSMICTNLFDKSTNGRILGSHLIATAGRHLFNLPSNISSSVISGNSDLAEKYSDIDEFSIIFEKIEPNFELYLKNDRFLCFSWLSMLNLCVTDDYLQKQSFEKIRRFVVSFTKWKRLSSKLIVGIVESNRFNTICCMIVNRLNRVVTTSNDPVHLLRNVN